MSMFTMFEQKVECAFEPDLKREKQVEKDFEVFVEHQKKINSNHLDTTFKETKIMMLGQSKR